jgi:hypothetical protein
MASELPASSVPPAPSDPPAIPSAPTAPKVPMPPTTPAAPLPPPRKSRWWLYGCGTFLVLILVIIVTVITTLWWLQRPIKPVVLTAAERSVVDQKLQRMGGGNPLANPSGAPASARAVVPDMEKPPVPLRTPAASSEPDRPYVPGAKVFKLTERELNGLLNANTDLGKSVRLEFARDAINAYLVVPIPEDFPIGGGKMFRARGRFGLSLGNGGVPYAVLEDITVFGLSLPKAWLGGLKGQNLLGQAMGERPGSPLLQGIKSLRIEPGALVIELEN